MQLPTIPVFLPPLYSDVPFPRLKEHEVGLVFELVK